jgi:uncharacterized surface protein with fasciclin (FAS1) repeats
MKATHLKYAALTICLATSMPAVYSQSPATGETTLEKKPEVMEGSLTAKIRDSVTFSTLTKALKAAELDLVLGSKDEFTIFAPTDEAFGKLPAAVLAKLMLPENKEKLRSLLLYHVVSGKVLSSDLKDGDVKTMNGEKLKVEVDGDEIEVDDSKVFSANVAANNGIMHSIGTVLVPNSLEGFAGLE